MDQQYSTVAKIPMLDTGKFEQWQFRMQQYLQHEHYALWEVIEFEDSYEVPEKNPSTTTTSTTSGEKSGRTVTLTTEDMMKKKNDVKARTTLLLSLPDEHQLRFSKHKTARELWAVILKTFGGNEATKKTKKNLLKQQYGNFRAEGTETLEQMFTRLQVIVGQLQFMGVEVEQDDLNQKFLTSLAPEWLMHTIVWRNRSELDTMSLDDLYNHLKGNDEVNIASVYTASSNVSTASVNVATASINQETACAYIASQSGGKKERKIGVVDNKHQSINQSMSNALVNGLAGAGGGMIAQILTYPLQSVNTRQQTERISKKSQSNKSSSTLFQILEVIRSEGVGGLYSGLKPSLLGTATSQGIYYYFYQVFKNKAESIAAANKRKGLGDGTVGMFSWLVVAALAGALNVLFTNPIWVLVTRMQTHTQAEQKILEAKKEALLRESSESNLIGSSLNDKLRELESLKPNPYGTLHAAYEVYNEAGLMGFWKGIIPTLIMVCNPSIQFMIYESSIKYLKTKRAIKKQSSHTVTALEVFLVGAIAKLGATVTTYPLLVVKSRLQAKQEISTNNSLRYSGTMDAIVKMIQYEGLSCFYKGMSTKIVQSVFAASVLFMIKEELVKLYATLAKKSQKILLTRSN
uniref:Peroxisomal nicotinamide adenine dinucleotide carrier-like n=1 Tax=Tanacetum cinerariifolium TaxID=118510 RepID=A0A6L2KBJ3_TANCI|nr:peroxisomal nicotinamide adenine dinucleotide carrier-like [Tanacetum cinerariifolium]